MSLGLLQLVQTFLPKRPRLVLESLLFLGIRSAVLQLRRAHTVQGRCFMALFDIFGLHDKLVARGA